MDRNNFWKKIETNIKEMLRDSSPSINNNFHLSDKFLCVLCDKYKLNCNFLVTELLPDLYEEYLNGKNFSFDQNGNFEEYVELKMSESFSYPIVPDIWQCVNSTASYLCAGIKNLFTRASITERISDSKNNNEVNLIDNLNYNISNSSNTYENSIGNKQNVL